MYLPALARTGDVPKFMKPMIAKMDLFRTFYVTHRLYYFWFSILLIHSPNFWKFRAVPGTIWFLSKFLHFVQFRLLSGATEFGARLEALPDKVTKVTIPYKAAHSKLTAGSYVRIMLPDIAVHEFHPFSVASSGTREELVLYCKAVGPWTKKLLSLAQERQYTGVLPSDFAVYLPMPPLAATGISGGGKPNYNQSVSVGNQDSCRNLGGALTSDVNMSPSLRKCVVVGPFGAPAASMFHVKRAVVMAGGIGVTPFAALLDTLLDISEHPEKKPRNFALERVHFVWTVRNMESLSWIEDLINQVELRRAKDTELRQMLQLHIYVTSKKSAENIGAQFLQLLRMGEDGYDAISGLRHAVEFGRPDIDGLLGEIGSESKHMPTVFFCGPPFLGKTIGKVAAKYKMRFAEEHF
ncbi:hypothetical protein SARC_11204 [Sphaeroforma arctica JP610]|uniref:FAD-binding FR-type domain-containing protein n=1 Tax=Sphaeroforma arctica JP610 TaxID=667725 RepID=A0A0L0FHN2_9EUKA|nr:hypothetical protein SARC_11204 [Sphaeroforma arctica JP610]KNC76287.1 hypothetical protein SARC_11204 [Sphaeroforma arctica JP610]|eukprot:XP_014150189.1 hypothetical protein SARC_11204 [Sphaeroforma arctica JP610]